MQKSWKLQTFSPDNRDISVVCSVECPEDRSSLTVSFAGKGQDLAQIIFPSLTNEPARTDQLWLSTCFEFFLGTPTSSQYWEWNVSPSADWNVFHFTGYRESKREEERIENIKPTITISPEKFFLSWKIDYQRLDIDLENAIVQPTAILFSKKAEESFWAPKHSGTRADFHLQKNFEPLFNKG